MWATGRGFKHFAYDIIVTFYSQLYLQFDKRISHEIATLHLDEISRMKVIGNSRLSEAKQNVFSINFLLPVQNLNQSEFIISNSEENPKWVQSPAC